MIGRRLAVVLLLAALGPAALRAQAEQANSRDALLAERQSLVDQANQARERRDPAGAIRFAERALTIERRLFGERSPQVVESLGFLAALHEETGQLEAGERLAEEAFDILASVLDPSEWQLTDARLRVAHFHRRRSLSAGDNALLQKTIPQHATAFALTGEGRYREALALSEDVLQVRRRLLGTSDNATVAILNNVAYLLSRLGEFERARELYEEALSVRVRDLGDNHPSTARSRNNLAELLSQMGDRQGAEALYLDALATYRRLLGEEAASTLSTLTNLGVVYKQSGDLARAEEIFRYTLAVRRRTLGDVHSATASSLTNLATVYAEMADFARAQVLYEEALRIQLAVDGPDHPETASVMNSLAAAYDQLGETTRAIEMFEGALAIQRRALGPDHPAVAITLNNLALLLVEQGELDAAAPLFAQSTAIRRAVYGPSPFVAQSLSNEARHHVRRKDYARAEQLFREALELQRRMLPARHPDFEATLDGLGTMLMTAGDFARAEPLVREALEISLWNLDLLSVAQSERQLLLATSRSRAHLESYLLLTELTGGSPAATWSLTAGWKGRAMVRQRLRRAALATPGTRAAFERLQATATELSELALTVPPPEAAEKTTRRIRELTDLKEDLERQLAAAGGRERAGASTPAAIRSAIPPGAALVDIFEVFGAYSAFIVRRDGEIARVGLGKSEEVEAALERWHTLTKSDVDASGAARKLRDLVWAPIEAHLRPGEMLLVSPEGALGSLAFSALPGRAPERYLLEDHPLAMIPAPALLPEIAARAPGGDARGDLLAIGNVDYDAGAQPRAASNSGGRLLRAPIDDAAFDPLPGTSREIETLARIYRSLPSAPGAVSLSGADATEDAVREQASRFAYLHFATHGFFAPARFRSALLRSAGHSSTDTMNVAQSVAGYNPGLLSGLVFAGANKPAADSDGILTAAEVETLDLSNARLAVLSACETALGLAAGGEGLLGLQRAFLTAGAQTVIASTWNVDDEATRVLMERLYENLWTRRMGRLEALREAQLWMLRDGKRPFYWGAFVLSGDWR